MSRIRKYGTRFAGMTAHVLQRATGVLLLIYLFLHVHTIRQLRMGPAAFNSAVVTFRHPVFKLLEIALLATVVLHALNGVRITAVDMGWGHERQRGLFWIYVVGLGTLIFLAGAIPIFMNSVWKG
jgi:succinate dehydrogenase / fumarate reductase cytochrome b subunit